jgi:putative two-component system response regulator
MLVEDDDLLRRMTKTIIESDGHEVKAFVNGQLALDAFTTYNPELIVSDVSMPILDGFGLLQEIRKLPLGMAVPFLFLTARSEKQDVMQARNLGVDDYLTKPYQADELLDAVRSRLKRRMLTQMFDTREAHLQTIIMLANVIEARDVYTRGHVERVQSLAMELGRALNWSPEDLSMLEFGALLHDVGKVVVPEAILNKPGPLNPEELEVMRSHALAGAKMLEGVSHLYAAIPFARNHHEKWNGTGYPDRLAGTDIPLGGRVLALVDVYDALTTDRPYHKGMSKEQTLAIIEKDAGTHFDPEMAKVFIELQRAKPD